MRLINIHTSTCTKPVHWYCVSNVVMQSKCTIEYHRTGFNCENLIITNYEFFWSSQTFDSQTYSINSPPLCAICADAIIKFAM